MNRIHPILLIAAVALLTGCGSGSNPSDAEATPEEEHADNIVTLTGPSLELAGIKTETVKAGAINTTVKAVGRVGENLNKTARAVSPLEGRLAKLNFDINDPVRVGEVLALVQVPELLGKPLELKAPRDGVITERRGAVGELVDKAAPIYTISDPSDLWVIAEVKERDLAAVKPGQNAAFKVIAYPGETFRGRVARLGSQIEEDSRTLEARIETDNPGGRLKPGMFADVEITTTILDGVIVIPDSALQSDGDQRVVFVVRGNGQFEKRPVVLGLEQNGHVQVLEGLTPGDQIVTDGSFILKSELLKGELGEE